MSWDGTLSSGGVQKHGSGSHTVTGVTAGFYNAPYGINVDATGAITGAYQAWSPTPTYPANTLVLASDSKLYKAVVSNQGNNPTTDSGTNWVRVSLPQKPNGTLDYQSLTWDPATSEFVGTALLKLNTTTSTAIIGGALDMSTHQIHNVVDPTSAQDAATKAYVDAHTGGSGLPSGTDTQTLRNNAGTWIANSFLANSGSQLTVNAPTSPTSGVPVVIRVAGTSAAPAGLEIQDETSTDPCCVTVKNTGTNVRLDYGIAGAASDFITGTAQGDGIIRHSVSGKRLWIGSKVNSGDTTATAIASFSQTGVVIGSTSSAAAKLDVTAGASQPALKLTGASGQPALSVVSSSNPSAAILVTGDNTTLLLNSSTALGSNSGGTVILGTSLQPTAAGQSVGTIYFAGTVSTLTSQGWIIATAAESWSSTAKGTQLGFWLTTAGGTTASEKLHIYSQGDVCLSPTNSSLATSSTTGFTHFPNMSGAPTASPTNTRTGATAEVIDITNFRKYNFISSAWMAQGIGHTMLSVVNVSTPPTSPGSYTVAAGVGLVLGDTSNGQVLTVTLPSASTNSGRVVTVKNIAGGLANLSITPASGDNIDSGSPGTITISTNQRATLASNGSGWFRID